MRETILTLLVGVIYLIFWMWQVDDNNTGLANERLKNAVNYASHDASLQIDKTQLANGKMVFNTVPARQTFEKTLRDNLFLQADLTPQPNTMLKDKVEIIYEDYIDDNDGVIYPYYYENNIYSIRDWIRGPAVIFAVEVARPRAFNLNPEYKLVKWSIFEYPIP